MPADYAIHTAWMRYLVGRGNPHVGVEGLWTNRWVISTPSLLARLSPSRIESCAEGLPCIQRVVRNSDAGVGGLTDGAARRLAIGIWRQKCVMSASRSARPSCTRTRRRRSGHNTGAPKPLNCKTIKPPWTRVSFCCVRPGGQTKALSRSIMPSKDVSTRTLHTETLPKASGLLPYTLDLGKMPSHAHSCQAHKGFAVSAFTS